jgi:hypothetical protein
MHPLTVGYPVLKPGRQVTNPEAGSGFNLKSSISNLQSAIP